MRVETAPTLYISTLPGRRIGDPGAARLRAGVAAVVALAAAGAAAGLLAAGPWRAAAVLGAVIVVAELTPVRLSDGREVPLSAAALLTLVPLASPAVFAVVVAGSFLPATFVRSGPWRGRLLAAGLRMVAGAGAYAAFRGVSAALADGPEARMAALAAAGAVVVAFEVARPLLRGGLPECEAFVTAGGLRALAAVSTVGVLMALAVAGTGSGASMGLWGVPVLAVPLLATRYAFERLHAIALTYDQTIDVLSVVPEMGGRTAPGRGRRLAELSVEMGRLLGLRGEELADLERAARLHALGHVTLDADTPRHPVTARSVARATAGMLATDHGLSRPASLVAASADRDRAADLATGDRLAAEILRAASAFEASGGAEAGAERSAYEFTRSAGGVDDRRVIVALERVLERRRLSTRRV